MRVFSEAEIGQILQRAAERQAEATQAVPHAGLTLAELEALAAESGLDAAHVRAAAAEIAPTAPAERSRSATHVFVERTLDAPLTDDGWDDVVAELRNRFGKAGMAAFSPGAAPSGDVAVVGKNREWTHTDGLGVETRVLATDRGGAARLRLSQRVGMMSEVGDALLVGVGMGFLPALLLAGLLPGPKPLVTGAVIALFVVLVWWADVAWRKAMHDRLEALSGDLAALLAAHAAEPAAALTAEKSPALDASPNAVAPAAPTPMPAAPLSLDALGEAPEAVPSSPQRNLSGSRT
jgi:hypothetical protein